jgi:hypothetical protein
MLRFPRPCSTGDARTPMKSWEPSLNGRTLSHEPAAEDGDVFHLGFFAENDSARCVKAKADHPYSFDVRDADGGGLAVNLRGNVQFADGFDGGSYFDDSGAIHPNLARYL